MWQIHYRIDVITFYALKPGMHSEMGDALVVTGGASTANRIGIHFSLEQKFGQEETWVNGEQSVTESVMDETIISQADNWKW